MVNNVAEHGALKVKGEKGPGDVALQVVIRSVDFLL